MKSITTYLFPHGGSWRADLLSGLTVALALIPEAIAFALVAGVNPLVGLMAAFFMCFITALIGGRPGMISGATGATAIVLASLMQRYGIEYLFATIVLTGIIEVIVGLLHLGKLIRMMPKSVMVGFVNGLAIVIFLAQLQQFTITSAHAPPVWLSGWALYSMLGLVLIAMFITHYLPRVTKAVPAALAAIITVSLIVVAGCARHDDGTRIAWHDLSPLALASNHLVVAHTGDHSPLRIGLNRGGIIRITHDPFPD